MINRRGLPEEIISDNGTNFVAAEKELRKLTNEIIKDPNNNDLQKDKMDF